MRTRLGFVLALMASVFMCLTPAAEAHRVGIPVTTLEWHEPSGVWHLVHRLSVHDFAGAVDGLDGAELESPQEQALLGRYVIEHFALAGQSHPIEVSYLGAEEEGGTFFVYFQIASPDQTIEIDNDLVFAGDDDDQRRHALVNIGSGADVSTLLFTSVDGAKAVDLIRPVSPN